LLYKKHVTAHYKEFPMKYTNKAWLLVTLIILATAATSFAESSAYGAGAATQAIAAGRQFTVNDMLRWAAEDEYLARGEYEAIMGTFGNLRPYSNIMAAEEQHLAWLKAEYQTRGLPFPADGSAPYVVLPGDLRAAAQAGVDAEIANIAMYKAFLARPEVSDPANASVKVLFEQLMRASENHLRAFRNQLARY
jgi:hypothetical protein